MKFRFIEDPGHAWLEVPIKVLRELGIVNCISQYSYYHMEGCKAYLEEDCDAPIFVMQFEKSKGYSPTFETKYEKGDSYVRSLGSYPFTNRPAFEAKLNELTHYYS